MSPDGLLCVGVHQRAEDSVGGSRVALHHRLGVAVHQATSVTPVKRRTVQNDGVLNIVTYRQLNGQVYSDLDKRLLGVFLIFGK